VSGLVWPRDPPSLHWNAPGVERKATPAGGRPGPRPSTPAPEKPREGPPRAEGGAADDAFARAIPAGTVLADRYAVRAALGGGPHGAVYRVLDRVRDRDVALKVILPSRFARAGPGAAERFASEVGAALDLAHERIVRIFDVGVDRATGLRFFTMELLEGTTLRRRLDDQRRRGGHADPEWALEVGRQLFQALAAAHRRATPHGDLKPENVLLLARAPDEPPAVKVLDFGGAALCGGTGSGGGPAACYVAPELTVGGGAAPDAQSDVYSASAVLYEVLTGERPIGRFPAPGEIRRDLSPAVDAAVLRGLEASPARRFASAAEALAALDAAEEGGAREGRGPSGGRRTALVAGAIAGVLILGGGAVAAAVVLPKRARAERLRAAVAVATPPERVAALRAFLERYPGDREGATALESALRDLTDASRREAVAPLDTALRIARLEAFLRDHPGDARATAALGASRAAARLRRLAEAVAPADLATRVDKLEPLAAEHADDPGIKPVAEATSEAFRVVVWRQVALEIARGEPDIERRVKALEAHLARHPGHAEAEAELDRARTDLALRDLRFIAAITAPTAADKVRLLESYVRDYPTDAAGSTALAAARREADDAGRRRRLEDAVGAETPSLAIERLTAYLRDYPDDPDARTSLAVAHGMRAIERHTAGDLRGALGDADTAVGLAPALYEVHAVRAKVRSESGDVAGAIADWSEAIRLHPGDAELHYQRGVLHGIAGRFADSIADLDRAIALEPARFMAWAGRGIAKLRSGDAAGAVADETEAIRLKPDWADAYVYRGTARELSGDVDGAIADHTRALALDPRSARAHYNRGNARVRKRDLEGALADFEAAKRLDPAHPDAGAAVDAVRRALGR